MTTEAEPDRPPAAAEEAWIFLDSGHMVAPNIEIARNDTSQWTLSPRYRGESDTKPTNPKDDVGVRKWRQLTCIPMNVLAEVGVGMLEGDRKYGRHNYREAGVRASVYVDAAMGHMLQFWEGEDVDPDSGLSHITKAICSLFVLRDAMQRGMVTDDRPPKTDLDALRADLQATVDELFERYPNRIPPVTQTNLKSTKSGA